MKKISVITINYNDHAGLKKTIASVKSQSFSNFEYIVIDGGSTDPSPTVIKENNDIIDHGVSEKDRGIYHAMNKGIASASGEYLLFLNSGDSFYSPHSLQRLAGPEPTKDLIYGNLLLQLGNDSEERKYPDNLRFSSVYSNSLPHPATLIKKTLFDKIGPYDEKLKIAADWKFFIIALFQQSASYEHRDTIVSNFDLKGISSIAETQQRINAEKEQTLREHFPNLADDILELQKLKKLARKVQKNPLARVAFAKHLTS